MNSSNSKVTEFLIDIQTTFPEKLEIVEIIRKIFFDENPEIEEDIKYGGIIFTVLGELVGGIFLYKQHISIEFSNGYKFNDKNNFLQGKGKMRRHLKILDKNDLVDKDINYYVRQAVKI